MRIDRKDKSFSINIENRKQETWFYDGTLVAEMFAHIHFRKPGEECGETFFAEATEDSSKLTFQTVTPFGTFQMKYDLNPSMEDVVKTASNTALPEKSHLSGVDSIIIEIAFEFTKDCYGGLDFCMLKRPEELKRCRLYDMMVSGWSDENRGIIFYPVDDGNARQSYIDIDRGRIQTIGISAPPGINIGEQAFKKGDLIRGKMVIGIGEIDILNPELCAPLRKYQVPAPVRNYNAYIDLWKTFLNRKGLWIELGDNMGMFHRGWCRFLSEEKYSGVLWDNRQTIYKPLIELAWGGSANLILMETLFRMNDSRASKILRTLLHFKDGAFQHENGSWINAYQVSEEKFSDRYGREYSTLASGGLVNYFMWRCIKKGYIQNTEKILFNKKLTGFLSFIEHMRAEQPSSDTSEPGIKFGEFWDGRPGETRYAIPYEEPCYAVSDALALMSYLIAGMLAKTNGQLSAVSEDDFSDTENPTMQTYLNRYRQLLFHLLEHIECNNWRFFEFDTHGSDAVAPSWILLVLDEVLEYDQALSETEKERVFNCYHKTYHLIHSYIRHREDYADAVWNAAENWGGKTKTQGGIIHGSSAGVSQGSHSVHLRYDFPLAMGAYARRTGSAAALADWEGYLNWMTWLQFSDPRWPGVIGSATEHITFKTGYVQDTAQIKHSNPIAMLEWLEFQNGFDA